MLGLPDVTTKATPARTPKTPKAVAKRAAPRARTGAVKTVAAPAARMAPMTAVVRHQAYFGLRPATTSCWGLLAPVVGGSKEDCPPG